MNLYHDAAKGVTTIVVGISGTAYGLLTKALVASHVVADSVPPMVSTPAGAFRLDNLSTYVGAVTTIGGILWTQYLLRRSEKREADRRDRIEDGMAGVKIFLAEEMAKVQVHQIRLASHLEQQDVAIRQIGQNVQGTGPAGDGGAK